MENETDSLRVVIASLDRHLKEAGYSISIAKDKEIANSRKVFEGKPRFLSEQGYFKRSHASQAWSQRPSAVIERALWQSAIEVPNKYRVHFLSSTSDG